SRRGKKGASVGSGGMRRKALEGKGPTPKAEERPGHKAYRAPGRGGSRRQPPGRGPGRRRSPGSDQVAGRNAVRGALSEEGPATQLTVMARTEMDGRVGEIMRLAGTRSLPIAEASRTYLDRLTDHAVHQGVALTIPP